MVQLIGFMVAAYIFTRMVELVQKKETSGLVATFAVITMIVVLLSVIGLFGAGSEISSLAR